MLLAKKGRKYQMPVGDAIFLLKHCYTCNTARAGDPTWKFLDQPLYYCKTMLNEPSPTKDVMTQKLAPPIDLHINFLIAFSEYVVQIEQTKLYLCKERAT